MDLEEFDLVLAYQLVPIYSNNWSSPYAAALRYVSDIPAQKGLDVKRNKNGWG